MKWSHMTSLEAAPLFYGDRGGVGGVMNVCFSPAWASGEVCEGQVNHGKEKTWRATDIVLRYLRTPIKRGSRHICGVRKVKLGLWVDRFLFS